MDDSDFDLCECTILSHEWAMRRLLSLLRQSQTYCTDNECLNELPGNPNNSTEQDFLLMTFCWILLALILYYFRPASLRSRSDVKPREDGPSGNPPVPPPLH